MDIPPIIPMLFSLGLLMVCGSELLGHYLQKRDQRRTRRREMHEAAQRRRDRKEPYGG